MNPRLALALATFVGWLLITLVGEQLGAGANQALSETVSKGPGWPFIAAAAFLVALSSLKDVAAPAAPGGATALAPILLVLPNALYGLWLMRNLGKAGATAQAR